MSGGRDETPLPRSGIILWVKNVIKSVGLPDSAKEASMASKYLA